MIPGVASLDREFDVRSFVGPLWTHRSVAGRIGIVAVLVGVVGLVGFGGWQWLTRILKPVPELPLLYSVRVVPIDEDGRPIQDATVGASVGHEPQQVAGGWEIEIPRVKLPADGLVTLRAEQESTSAKGRVTIILGDDSTPSVEIPLQVPEARVRGIIVDATGRALHNARVSVLGYGDEARVTDGSGSFELVAHRTAGERVRIHVEHPQYGAKQQYCFAGSSDCYIELGRTLGKP